MNSDYPCKECGHEFGAHKIDGPWNKGCKRCSTLIQMGLMEDTPFYWFHDFTPDNLAYLELRFEASTEDSLPPRA